MDKDFEQISERLRNYEAQPEAKLWEEIARKAPKAKINYLFVCCIAAAVALGGFVTMLILAPENPKIIKNTSEESPLVINSKTESNETAFQPSETAKEFSKTAKEFSETAIHFDQTATTENQSVTEADLKQESKEEVEQKTLISERKPTAKEVKTTPIQTMEVSSEPMVETKAEIEQSAKAPTMPEDTIKRMELFIPNAFTPSEARNNRFAPAEAEVKDYRMDIYNRQGVVLFTTNNIREAWDGTSQGEICPQGVYYYIVKFTDLHDNTHTQKGSLMLLR